MVESLKELNRICQKPRYRETGNWMVRNILRDLALPITWLLLHTPVTAHQVTTASLIIAVGGIALFAVESPAAFFIGALLLQLWYLLDHVDGQIARYRKTASLSGRFFDFLTHHIVHTCVFFALGLYAYGETGSFFYVIAGFLSALGIAVFNLINDTKCKTFIEKIDSAKEIQVKPEETQEVQSPETRVSSNSARRIFSILHKLCEIHVLMNLLTLAAILDMFLPETEIRMPVFWFYGSAAVLLAVAKAAYLIRTGKIDSEFNSRYSAH